MSPNPDGLPGLTQLREIVGALLTWGLVACVAGLVISAIVWAVGSDDLPPARSQPSGGRRTAEATQFLAIS